MGHRHDTQAGAEIDETTIGLTRAIAVVDGGEIAGLSAAEPRRFRMPETLRGRVVAIAVAGTLATTLAALSSAASTVFEQPLITAAFLTVVNLSYLGVGLYTWWHRPESRVGPLITAVGLLYNALALSGTGDPLVHPIGIVAWSLAVVYTAYVYLAFPRGRLTSRLERRFVIGFAATTIVLWLLILPLSPTVPMGGALVSCGARCPPNGYQLIDAPTAVTSALSTLFHLLTAAAALLLVALVVHRTRISSYLRRRAMLPLAIVLPTNIILFVAALLVPPADPGTGAALRIASGLAQLSVPVALLLGQIRGELFAARRLGQIAIDATGKQLTSGGVQQLVGEALGDTSLTFALWSEERAGYVDVDGHDLTLPEGSSSRGVTRFTQDGAPVAALVHDPSLATGSEMVDGLAATSLMLLENTRLVQELRASRGRIVASAQRERLRLERNLHDGAQQRLMAVQVRLRMAQRHADPGLAAELDAIADDAAGAVDDLRALAHGIYPSALRDLGLAAALQSMAINGPIPVRVHDTGIGRCEGAVEQAIYFCALEAVQNAGKHAGPTARATIELGRESNIVHFEVADDGGGMDLRVAGGGVGLVSMRDRIGAVGGTLEISSTAGRGTVVRGSVPDEPALAAAAR